MVLAIYQLGHCRNRTCMVKNQLMKGSQKSFNVQEEIETRIESEQVDDEKYDNVV